MGDIDISKLTGAWLEFAQQADKDGNGDGKLNLNPNSIWGDGEGKSFKDAAMAAGKTEDDIKNLFNELGVQINPAVQENNAATAADTQAETTPVEQTDNTKTVAKKTQKSIRKDLLQEIKSMAKGYVTENGIDWKKFAADLKNKIQNETLTNEAYYSKLLDAVESVATMMDGTKYNSKADIKKIKSDVGKKLKADKKAAEDTEENNMINDFKSDVLKTFVETAKEHQMQKENKELTERYNELRTNGKSREDAFDALKEEYKDKDSYYSGILTNKSAFLYRITHFRKKMSNFEKQNILPEANQEVRDAIYHQKGKEKITDRSDVRKEAKKELGNNNDMYTKKILRGEMSFNEKMSFSRSVIKDYERYMASENRIQTIKAKEHSEKDLRALFKKGHFEQMVRTELEPLITKNENGTYNISALSDLIKSTISPADNRADYQKSSLSEEGEIENVIKNIAAKTGVSLKRSEAKALIDYCGFDRDRRNLITYIRDFYNGTLGGLINSAGSLVTGLTTNMSKEASTLKQISAAYATTNVTTNFAEINNALLNIDFPIKINANNSIYLDLGIELTTFIDGNKVNGTLDFDEFDVMMQLAGAGFKKGEVSFEIVDGNLIRLVINKENNTSYEDLHKLSEILGENFNLEKDLGLKAEATTEVTEGKYEIEEGKEKDNKKDAILKGILTTLVLNIVLECLKELPGEKDFLQTTVTAKTLEGYSRELENNKNLKGSPRAKTAILQLAQLFIKKDANGNPITYKIPETDAQGNKVLDAQGNIVYKEVGTAFDNEAYQKLLETFAGPKSFLNKSELINGIDLYMRDHKLILKAKEDEKLENTKPEEKPVEYKTPVEPKKEVETPQNEKQDEKIEKPEEPKIETVDLYRDIKEGDFTIDGNKYLWKDIIKVYPKFAQKYDEATAVRMLKLAQAIDSDACTEENLKELADLSFNNPEALLNREGFNYDIWLKFKGGTGTVKLPENFCGDKLQKDKLEQHKSEKKGNYVKDAKANVSGRKETYRDGEGTVFNSEGDAEDKHKGKKINKHY